MKMISHNEEETQRIATVFSKQLHGGEVVLLYGDLGAGKTVFIKAIAKALGIAETVKSPTFNIMKLYKIETRDKGQETRTLCHIDAYRLKNFDDLLDIGADEYLGKENIIGVIEWAERAKGAEKFSKKIIKIKIEHGKKDDERKIIINC